MRLLKGIGSKNNGMAGIKDFGNLAIDGY